MISHEAWWTEMLGDKDLILEIRNGLRDAYLKMESSRGGRRNISWVVFVRSPETGNRWHRAGRGRTQEEAVQEAKEAGKLPSSITAKMIPVRENIYAEGRKPKL